MLFINEDNYKEIFEIFIKFKANPADLKAKMIIVQGDMGLKERFVNDLKELNWVPYPGKYPIFHPNGLTVDELILGNNNHPIATCNLNNNTYQTIGEIIL